MPKQKSDTRAAVKDILVSLKDIFEKYTRHARTSAWRSIKSGPAQREIDRLLNSPTRPLIGPRRFANKSFKEWLEDP